MEYIKKAFVLLLALFIIIFGGCGKAETSEAGSPAEGITGETEEEEPVTVTFEDTKEDTAGSEEIKFIIEKKDADILLTEALDGTDCKAVFIETVEIGSNGYYTYSVTDPEGKDLEKGLAVDGFSGEVCVYDPTDGKTEDFDRFLYYDKSSAKYRDISWDGDFTLESNLRVSLIPADEDSFEFTVYKKDEELISGVARTEGDRAEWTSSDEKETISFQMVDEDTLRMVETGSLRISGQYVK